MSDPRNSRRRSPICEGVWQRGSVFSGANLGAAHLGERICGTQDVIEQREGRSNLDVMKALRPLVASS